MAFVLPLAVWCLISYVPFIWHPLVLVTDPGAAHVAGTYDYLEAGQRVEREVFDADGSALVIHASADDNVSDPAGNAGDRIACGVITE